MGSCIKDQYRLEGKKLPTLKLATGTGGRLCQDVSQWQGYTPDLAGVSCVIIQSNYGENVEPSVYSQQRDARAHHVPFGCYTFLEPGVSGEASAGLANRVCGRSSGQTLGLWADAEVDGSYSHACSYTARAQHLGDLAGLYSSPGLWPGGRCAGYLWPAEWGGSVYAFGGYPRSAIKLRQWCGTCYLHGVSTDLDEDLGLIALGKPPPPACTHNCKVAQLHRAEAELRGLRADIVHLRILLARHSCRNLPRPVVPNTHAQRVLCAGWLAKGQQDHRRGMALDALIARLHKEGV